MLKAEIRKKALKDRLLLTDATYDALNQALLNQFKTLDFGKIKTLHLFLPITEKKEPDTFPMIDWLAKNHPEIKIIVPKADFETALMTHHEYIGSGDLKKNIYHILEPQKGKPYEGEIDLVIVPLLAFDLQGYRAGYGKGFYDRFLQNINAQKIGLSLYPAIEKIDDVNEHDVRLDFCITPTGIIKF
ncbi:MULTISPECIES: 5-formyltetrahydrofolate cyclo-ligase [Pedobacter]|uniref:5-formyltetrahydrofolate cyclo-ligase n=1 Tax=Pedobacter zeae TaxID=1737356 RepID=A0A7W6KD17_9SPHI|nr:5-formyltetrahydrofolate cyclo-ligase [Pedobacter zeae]MBB4109465.1 5-formyltetrahydrofolate cyclo-ligase [Pedobacter zeae]GGH12386.1 5-formyltetrahydrofolate cyclo-ligase [Pedobacter zeae]